MVTKAVRTPMRAAASALATGMAGAITITSYDFMGGSRGEGGMGEME